MIERLIELMRSHARDCISYDITDDAAGLFDSKVGGPFYVPEGEGIPEIDGIKLSLLAQINLEQQPAIEGFPSKGLLQFFVADYGYIGLRDHRAAVRYIADVPATEEVRIVDEPPTDFPFDGTKCFALKARKAKCIPAIDTNEYNQILQDSVPELLCDKAYGMGFENFYVDEFFYETLTTLPDVEIGGTLMGGYPEFTQWDPRNPGEYDTLLFQLSSDLDHVCWGDCGIGNFFISKENLQKLDFSDILYNWDCH